LDRIKRRGNRGGDILKEGADGLPASTISEQRTHFLEAAKLFCRK
jgi:hypothetical protein